MAKITEEQIEIAVEKKMDRLDARLLGGTISQEEYDHLVKELNKWAEQQTETR